MMQKQQIHKVIDNKIIENFGNGYKIYDERADLHFRFTKFSTLAKNELKISTYDILKLDPDTVNPTKIRHYVIYAQHCNKRLDDMDWMLNNKYKFRGFTNSKIFNLIKLKERLSEENATILL